MTLTRASLAEKLALELGIDERRAYRWVGIILDEMVAVLQEGENLELSGLGNFEVRHKAERPGLNPKTLEKVMVSARSVIVFKCGKKLKTALQAQLEPISS